MNNSVEELCTELYNNIKDIVNNVLIIPSIEDSLLILKTICTAGTIIEEMNSKDQKIRGRIKKKVVISTCRQIISDYVSPYRVNKILEIYDSSSNEIVEEVIQFAKKNKRVTSYFKTCCH